MAGKRKAEGIALLSLYYDDEEEEEEDEEEDDDDQEDGEEDANEAVEEEFDKDEDDHIAEEEQAQTVVVKMEVHEVILEQHISTSEIILPSVPLAPEQAPVSSPLVTPPQALPDRSGIVDYAHDEFTMSPEAEEGEILSLGRAVIGSDIQASNGSLQGGSPPGIVRVLTPEKGLTRQSNDQMDQSNVAPVILSGETAATVDEAAISTAASSGAELGHDEVVGGDASQADPLADFLPPQPTTKCSDDLQRKFSKYIAFKNAGRSFNEDLRKSKGYRNPDFLQRAVKHQEIDQIGSCFRKEIFDPHGYDPSDFYDALALELRREMDRKEQAKKQSQRVDFVHGGVQGVPAMALPDKSKPSVPVLGGQKASTGPTAVSTSSAGSHVAASVQDNSAKGDGRSSKKSKWDKVDTDGRAPPTLPAVAKTAIAAASAHAALLTANAGAGYASFAQQKRKEAEERSRATDKSAVKSEKK